MFGVEQTAGRHHEQHQVGRHQHQERAVQVGQQLPAPCRRTHGTVKITAPGRHRRSYDVIASTFGISIAVRSTFLLGSIGVTLYLFGSA